ncbi:hypothetical protein CXG81DRAFT_20596 [Caulochytrium protostelioides]|uniref:Uncharacterized protein n=1 Tax=Caulochytrium protostelioides TaxID=1555241 RepID=A0A4P9X2C0_9FUNG|nr:hypothetical protein CXG81DRAFT_20596 [Caulochytrium protostelioides]|eukprot:RKO99303.1 hypothetical protein CXG81DRAFT_20596 [Caulochytrium protostelioides]
MPRRTPPRPALPRQARPRPARPRPRPAAGAAAGAGGSRGGGLRLSGMLQTLLVLLLACSPLFAALAAVIPPGSARPRAAATTTDLMGAPVSTVAAAFTPAVSSARMSSATAAATVLASLTHRQRRPTIALARPPPAFPPPRPSSAVPPPPSRPPPVPPAGSFEPPPRAAAASAAAASSPAVAHQPGTPAVVAMVGQAAAHAAAVVLQHPVIDWSMLVPQQAAAVAASEAPVPAVPGARAARPVFTVGAWFDGVARRTPHGVDLDAVFAALSHTPPPPVRPYRGRGLPDLAPDGTPLRYGCYATADPATELCVTRLAQLFVSVRPPGQTEQTAVWSRRQRRWVPILRRATAGRPAAPAAPAAGAVALAPDAHAVPAPTTVSTTVSTTAFTLPDGIARSIRAAAAAAAASAAEADAFYLPATGRTAVAPLMRVGPAGALLPLSSDETAFAGCMPHPTDTTATTVCADVLGLPVPYVAAQRHRLRKRATAASSHARRLSRRMFNVAKLGPEQGGVHPPPVAALSEDPAERVQRPTERVTRGASIPERLRMPWPPCRGQPRRSAAGCRSFVGVHVPPDKLRPPPTTPDPRLQPRLPDARSRSPREADDRNDRGARAEARQWARRCPTDPHARRFPCDPVPALPEDVWHRILTHALRLDAAAAAAASATDAADDGPQTAVCDDSDRDTSNDDSDQGSSDSSDHSIGDLESKSDSAIESDSGDSAQGSSSGSDHRITLEEQPQAREAFAVALRALPTPRSRSRWSRSTWPRSRPPSRPPSRPRSQRRPPPQFDWVLANRMLYRVALAHWPAAARSARPPWFCFYPPSPAPPRPPTKQESLRGHRPGAPGGRPHPVCVPYWPQLEASSDDDQPEGPRIDPAIFDGGIVDDDDDDDEAEDARGVRGRGGTAVAVEDDAYPFPANLPSDSSHTTYEPLDINDLYDDWDDRMSDFDFDDNDDRFV